MATLSQIAGILTQKGCVRILAKILADNDNSKNQVYLGGGFNSINFLPVSEILSDDTGTRGRKFKATLNYSWIDSHGNESPAPNAQLILYPQYPEVRFSGFLRGSSNAPSSLMKSREAGRVLLFGIMPNGKLLGYVDGRDSSIAREVSASAFEGVFADIPLSKDEPHTDSRVSLLTQLRRIHLLEWINSKRLDSDGNIIQCGAPHCGGLTLEAELGITPNGYAEPDYMGWEVKQYSVPSFSSTASRAVTLMTPEPTGGYYKSDGVAAFILKYGYQDRRGRVDRLNFGGVHKFNQRHELTGLTLKIVGYDIENRKIIDSNGGIALIADNGEVAAMWGFAHLIKHWNKKHNKAVYIPSLARTEPRRQYYYGNMISLCEGADFIRVIDAFANQIVYYDPGIKMEQVSSTRRIKRRSQFRIKSGEIPALYNSNSPVDLLEATWGRFNSA